MTCTIYEPSDHINPGPAVPSTRRGQGQKLADLTTLQVGGPATEIVRAATEEELVGAVADADAHDIPVLVLGGGSNIVGAESFDGRVVLDTREEITEEHVSGCGGAIVTATAGTPWDDLVRYAIAREYSGIEALSGIPGSVGATPVQNVGAYGQEVGHTISSVRVYDRATKKRSDLARAELDLGYRSSALKDSLAQWGPTPRWVVLSVTFQFTLGSLSAPVGYGQLASVLGVDIGQRLLATEVRDAVLQLRRSKGMVLNDADRDTYSAGSFFTNPIIDRELVPEGAPAFGDGQKVKTSAAWLIDHAGYGKGYGGDLTGGRATLSTKHVLALTNRGGASTDDILTLARALRRGVHDTYGITLVNEPIILGATGPRAL